MEVSLEFHKLRDTILLREGRELIVVIILLIPGKPSPPFFFAGGLQRAATPSGRGVYLTKDGGRVRISVSLERKTP